MFGPIQSLWNDHIGPSRDFDRGDKKMAAVGAWTAATTLTGAAIGAYRGIEDVVTTETVPYPEKVQVPVGTRTVHGCNEYHHGFHYDAFEGEHKYGYHFGYNPNCVEQQTVYESQPTGRTLHREVTHHSVSFPHNWWQGAMLGLGVGLVTGIVGVVVYDLIQR